KRCNFTSSKWAEIPSEILDSIFEHLSFPDVLVSESVCSHWFQTAKSFISFKSQNQPPQAPSLKLFPQEDGTDGNGASEIVPEEFTENCCIGSSHSWLIFLDERAFPLLFNPSLRIRHAQLPCIGPLLGVLDIEKSQENGYYITYDYQKNPIRYMNNLRESLIHKAILSSDPCLNINNFGAVVICGHKKKIAYCQNGDNSWTDLDGKHQPYEDIICSRNQLYAIGSNASVEYLYNARLYLVQSTKGDTMLAARFVGELVNADDEPVHEHDLLTEEDTHPLVCPYKTLVFHVYKLDLGQKSWVEVGSLGDESLFLGANQSTSVSISSSSTIYKQNSIYFTDDYWDRMDEDYLYAGHDMGVFSLENRNVESFLHTHQLKILPPPCWVNPSPW
ncbi:hypothetical protein CISIN_1g039370mg, partial [Citrus sinensis]